MLTNQILVNLDKINSFKLLKLSPYYVSKVLKPSQCACVHDNTSVKYIKSLIHNGQYPIFFGTYHNLLSIYNALKKRIFVSHEPLVHKDKKSLYLSRVC